MHKDKEIAGLSSDWVGAKYLFVCVFRFIPHGGGKTHKQNSPKIPGQSREHFVFVQKSTDFAFFPRK